MTTIALRNENVAVLEFWEKKLGIKTHDGLITKWIEAVKEKAQQEFYAELGRPEIKAKPLKGKKINAIYKNG